MSKMPTGWDTTAHNSWLAGQRQVAIQQLLARLNGSTAKPVALQLQFAYYLFLCDDPASAAQVLEMAHKAEPGNDEVLRNLCACLSRAGQYELAVARLQTLLQRVPDDFHALDALCASLAKLDRYNEAAQAGTRSLTLKARSAGKAPPSWALPAAEPAVWLADGSRKPDVIAFSLWGSGPRYLRGAIDNVLAASYLYPGWRVRFYVDESVPAELLAALRELGAELLLQPAGQSLRQRLCWRFQVANDPLVGRFLVRDVDSVPGVRERLAVQEWLASTRWFHIMRDWWSHTDLVLAGMWGGMAGVLPPLAPLLEGYQPDVMETPNIDQWFLRDRLWGYLSQSCLVHDRCFTPPGAIPWPQPAPGGSEHVGQDIFTAQREPQARRLASWIARLPCLR
ncbi:MAG: tetratricopeptide repeat protein [Aeromonas hydrophila]|uniref:tetratricopeptide repeat protein n=1 Tax=Aeromonas hydrophila TaxID=644 RepID=UPI0029BA118C|nr:tetratricopeptide repeat protein [Aeromonas hydrophila]